MGKIIPEPEKIGKASERGAIKIVLSKNFEFK